MESVHLSLALILVAGIGAQWIAWRLHLASIPFLLLFGFAVGRIVDPDALFGAILMPAVSFAVAIILFEGGLELRLRELREAGQSVIALVSVGIAITWFLATVSARALLGFNWSASLIVGAILVVTGPTVVGPMLHAIRPQGQSGIILKWEGILNDAIGAVLAVLVLDAVTIGSVSDAPGYIAVGIAFTLGTGAALGVIAATLLVLLLRRKWVPDYLDVPVTVALILGVFALSNHFHHEAGLLAVTIMGVVLANQRMVDVRHVIVFKENLRVLLLSVLFIVLAARIDIGLIVELGWGSLAFVAVLIFIARPLTVFVCTVGARLALSDRIFMSFLAPRGIVAAAVASVFGLRMIEEGMPFADSIAPAVFVVITVTVLVYGLSAPILARRLGLAPSNRQGVVIVGGDPLCQAIAHALSAEGFKPLLIDVNRSHVAQARLAGLNARYGDALSEALIDKLNLSNMGTLLALTPNDHVNALAALHFGEVFGKDRVFQLYPEPQSMPGLDADHLHRFLRGHSMVGKSATYSKLNAMLRDGGTVKVTPLTEEFDYNAYRARYGENAIALLRISESGALEVNVEGKSFKPLPGDRVVSVVPADTLEGGAT